jgi:hypothetical protein
VSDAWLALVALLMSGVFGWQFVQGFRTGTMELPQPSITMSGRRADQPVRFWLVATLNGLLALAPAASAAGALIDG